MSFINYVNQSLISSNKNDKKKFRKISKIKNREDLNPLQLTINNFNSTYNSEFGANKFINTIENYAKHIPSKTFDEYNIEINNLMNNYIYSSPSINDEKNITKFEDDMTKTKKKFYKEEISNISKILNQSNRNYVNTSNTLNSLDINFKNPIDSLGLILRNKTIHDKLLMDNSDRSFQKFGQTMNKLNKIVDKKNLNQKIKISTIIPKINETRLFNINTGLLSENKKVKNDVKKKIISIPQFCFEDGEVFLIANEIYRAHGFPESREEFPFALDPSSNFIYLYSGLSSNYKLNSLWKLNSTIFKWEKIVSNNVNPEPRVGHSGIIYKNKFIIFGGRILNYNYYGNLEIYNIDTNQWSSPNVYAPSDFTLRRNHICCLIGQQMFIHGGISSEGEYLNDCYLLNLNPYKWLKISFKNYLDSPFLAYHSCCLVVPSEIKNNIRFNIYKYPESNSERKVFSRILEKGLYVFGGKSSNEKGAIGALRILRIGKKQLEWVTVEPGGKPPMPRYCCSMNFFEDGNYLIIHGGRNEINGDDKALNDTYVLELYKMEWLRVDFGDLEIKHRFGHSAVISGRNLIIFGGMNWENYLGSALFIINLDTEKAQEEKLKQKRGIFGFSVKFDKNMGKIFDKIIKDKGKKISKSKDNFKNILPKI